MKKSYVVLAALILLAAALLALAACNRADDPPAPPPAVQTPTPAPAPGQPTPDPTPEGPVIPAFMNEIGTLPIVNQPVTLSVFTGAGAGIDYTTNLGALEFEYRTGVSIDWIQVPAADIATRRNLMLATGDLPDIFAQNQGMSAAAIFHYASLGIFRPITPWIDPFAPELQRAFEIHPNIHDGMYMPDGHIYGFPAIDDCFHCSMNLKLWIYTPWLENLGLEIPRTPEELYNVLVAFRDNDPTGEGREIIPMAGAFRGWDHGINTLVNAWITMNQNRMIVDNGQIRVIYDTEEYREALRFVNRLFEEGLFAEDSLVLDRAGLRILADGGPDGANQVGVMPAMWVAGVSSHWNQGQWRVIPYLIGPGGHQVAVYNPLQANHRAVITNRVSDELMPVAVRWLDNFLTDESALLQVQGIEDLNWRRSDPGEVGIHGGPAMWERIPTPAGETPIPNTTMGQILPNFRSHEFRLSERANRSIIEQETLLYDESMLMLPFRDRIENIVPVLMFDEAVSAELVDIQTALETFVVESEARFVAGELCLDRDWDFYLRELNIIGLPRFLEIMQTAFNEREARLAGR